MIRSLPFPHFLSFALHTELLDITRSRQPFFPLYKWDSNVFILDNAIHWTASERNILFARVVKNIVRSRESAVGNDKKEKRDQRPAILIDID